MPDPTIGYEQQLPSLLANLNSSLQAQTQGNQSVLGDYMQYLQNRQNQVGEVNLPLMAFAAGLGSPTRTGSIGESLSLGLQSTMPYIQQGRQGADNRAAEMARIAMAKNSLAAELAQKQLEIAKMPLTAQGDIAGALGNRANIDYIRGGAAVPGVPGAKPGANVPGLIRGSEAQPPDFNQPPPPAVASAAPPAAPMPQPAPPAQQGPPMPEQAGPPMPPNTNAPPPAQMAGGSANDVITNMSPPQDLTVVAQANGVPTPPPASRAIPQYRPGPVQVAPGVVGYRPAQAVANQLDSAYAISKNRMNNRGSSLAAADADNAQKYLDKFREKGFEWDPTTKTLVPTGFADPAYIQASEYAKGMGSERAKAENTMTAVPTGAGGMGPRVLRRNSALLDDAQSAEFDRMGGGRGDDTISEPSPMSTARVKGIIEDEQQMQEAQKILPQTKVQLDAVKNILTKFESGKWAENKGEVIAALRSAGFDIKDPPADADPAAVQQMIKGSIDQVFKRVEEIGGRVLASEIIGLQKAVFDPNLQPGANRELVASLSAANTYTQKYINDYQQWRSENPYDTNTLKFKNEWSKANPFQDFKSREITNTVVKGAPHIPAKYYVPPDRDSLQPGQMWNHPEKGVLEVGSDGRVKVIGEL